MESNSQKDGLPWTFQKREKQKGKRVTIGEYTRGTLSIRRNLEGDLKHGWESILYFKGVHGEDSRDHLDSF